MAYKGLDTYLNDHHAGATAKVCTWKALKLVEDAYPWLAAFGIDELLPAPRTSAAASRPSAWRSRRRRWRTPSPCSAPGTACGQRGSRGAMMR